MKKINWLIWFLLIGCGYPIPGNSYTLILDDSLSTQNKVDVFHAIESWEAILDGKLSVNIVYGSCVSYTTLQFASGINYLFGEDEQRICIEASNEAYVDYIANATGNHTASVTVFERSDNYSNIWIPIDNDSKLTTLQMGQVIDHEIGHSFGLLHTQNDTIMCYNTDCASKEITCDDTAQWYAIRGMSNISKSCPNGGNFIYEH